MVIDGEVTLERSFGFANLEWDAPTSKETVFHIGSESKQFTAYLITKLIVEEKLRLNDDARHLLDYCDTFPYPLRIQDLLRHTSGMADYLSKNVEVLDKNGKAAEGFSGGRGYFGSVRVRQAIVERSVLQNCPAPIYEYSNSNYVILADIVSLLEGKEFATVAEEAIFQPLEMTRTFFDVARARVVERRATAYAPDLRLPDQYLSRLKNFDVVGNVGLVTTVDDLVKWEKNFWSDQLPNRVILERMLSFHGVKRDDGMLYRCGMEFGDVGGEPYVSHGGRMDGFKSVILRMPRKKLSLIYLSNCDVPFISSEAIGREIASVCA
ncbi:Beta-lactamase [Candidatus Burkholderia humilis]|nr:Beta-lactamase [Candidatus Burkholderia humilis]